MNMKECLVLNCKERFGKDRDYVRERFYNFPEDEEERKKWLLKCGREETFDYSNSAICSRHFCPDDFETVLKNNYLIRSLKKGVVPHVNVIEIKREPLDSDDYEYEGQVSPSTNSSPEAVVLKTEVDSNFFETPQIKENDPNVEASGVVPLEPIAANSSVPVINSVTSSTAAYAPSSLPASQNWSGQYDFNVSFGPQDKTTKGVSWTYSKLKDKLYVGKDVPCPINFAARIASTDGVVIRATALYSSPDHVSEVVHRCVNHSMTELSEGLFQAQHLVRCESLRATYEEDRTTKRHSVIVPFEHPPAGQGFSTYLYKFTCFGSCSGGPNRRPLMLIFALERGGRVVGRRKLDVKICACPGRDRKAEEAQVNGEKETPQPVKRKKEQDSVSLVDVLQFTKNIPVPPMKKAKPKNGQYTLNVNDAECFEFLRQMKKFYEMCKTVNNLPPSIKNILIHPPNRLKNNTNDNGPENEESETDQ